MKLRAVLTVSLLVASCGGPGRVAGVYQLDKDAMVKRVLAAAERKPDPETTKNVLEGMKMDLELKPDQSYVFRIRMPLDIGSATREGTWKLEGTEVLLTETVAGGVRLPTPETKRAKLDDGVLTIEVQGRSLSFRKQ